MREEALDSHRFPIDPKGNAAASRRLRPMKFKRWNRRVMRSIARNLHGAAFNKEFSRGPKREVRVRRGCAVGSIEHWRGWRLANTLEPEMPSSRAWPLPKHEMPACMQLRSQGNTGSAMALESPVLAWKAAPSSLPTWRNDALHGVDSRRAGARPRFPARQPLRGQASRAESGRWKARAASGTMLHEDGFLR